jgi:hypothetical protein
MEYTKRIRHCPSILSYDSPQTFLVIVWKTFLYTYRILWCCPILFSKIRTKGITIICVRDSRFVYRIQLSFPTELMVSGKSISAYSVLLDQFYGCDYRNKIVFSDKINDIYCSDNITDVTVMFCALTFMLFHKSQFMNVKEHLEIKLCF